MQIEEGKFYKTRSGHKSGPLTKTPISDQWHQTHPLTNGSETYRLDGTTSTADNEWPEDLIAEWKDEPTGPVTIETVKRINSGTFGRVSVGQTNPIGAAKATSVLVGVTTKSGGSSFNVDMDASELRAAADVFIQLADALEGK